MTCGCCTPHLVIVDYTTGVTGELTEDGELNGREPLQDVKHDIAGKVEK